MQIKWLGYKIISSILLKKLYHSKDSNNFYGINWFTNLKKITAEKH